AGAEQHPGDQRDCGTSHRKSVIPRYKMPNRKIHTTSTKCQYSVTAATPTWCCDENWPLAARYRIRVRRIRPPRTVRPGNPVMVKKALANELAVSVSPRPK